MAIAQVAQAPAENPWDNARQQLATVAERLKLDPGMREVLAHCKREFTVNFPVQMDDGTIHVFTGYRIHHNEARGPVKGGLRYSLNVSVAAGFAPTTSWPRITVTCGGPPTPAPTTRSARPSPVTSPAATYTPFVSPGSNAKKSFTSRRGSCPGRIDVPS